MERVALVFCVVLGSALLAACGESDEDQAQDRALEWVELVSNQDYPTACEMMTETVGDQKLCPQVLEEVSSRFSLDFPEVSNSSITGEEGKIEITTSGDTFVVLVEKDGDDSWSVDDINASETGT